MQPLSDSLGSRYEYTKQHPKQSGFKGREKAYEGHYNLSDDLERWFENHARVPAGDSDEDHEHEDNEKNLLDKAER